METLRAVVIVMVLIGCAASAEPAERVYTIEDAYRAALGSNEIVKIAQEDVSQSNYRVDQAWSFLYPRLNAQGVLYEIQRIAAAGRGAAPLSAAGPVSGGAGADTAALYRRQNAGGLSHREKTPRGEF